MAKKIRVFVYGTLKSSRTNNAALEGSTFVGRATITGKYAFTDLGWFPGVIEGDFPEREIGGEVWEVDMDTLNTLDCIEGHPSFYCRKKVVTSLGVRAFCYMLPSGYETRKPVTSLFWNENEAEQAWLRNRNEAATRRRGRVHKAGGPRQSPSRDRTAGACDADG
jgi:gamma-glutamylcyclotransferase (GGCT)/AIG2-like uncharacterized protein YtfP